MTVDVGRLGVWAPLELWTNEGARLGDAAAELEALGYSALWVGNGPGMFDAVDALLDATRHVAVATGIANIKAHPVETTAAWYAKAAARNPDRVLLGLGGGWGRVEPRECGRPVTWYARMVEYLDKLDAWSPPAPRTGRVLAANGPRMLALARDRGVGAHPFLVTQGHTRRAREILGPAPLLAPEQKIVLERDPAKARAIGRRNLGFYLTKPNYARVLRTLGFAEHDLAGGGSDRLVDALVAWGDPDAAMARIDEHFDAGADHTALHLLTDDTAPEQRGHRRLPLAAYRRLAEAANAAPSPRSP